MRFCGSGRPFVVCFGLISSLIYLLSIAGFVCPFSQIVLKFTCFSISLFPTSAVHTNILMVQGQQAESSGNISTRMWVVLVSFWPWLTSLSGSSWPWPQSQRGLFGSLSLGPLLFCTLWWRSVCRWAGRRRRLQLFPWNDSPRKKCSVVFVFEA